MGRQKRTPGLVQRKGIWHIDKQVRGTRICESTGESNLKKAEQYLAKRIEENRQAVIYGVRPKRTFRQAATKYLNESTKATIHEDAMHLKMLDPFIGSLPLDRVNMNALQSFIKSRENDGVKARTINYGLQTVRQILNVAASEWVDGNGMTWLTTAPKIKMRKLNDVRKPYPLTWEEQNALFGELPQHLVPMALFKVNTGTREQEVCGLRWEWEVKLPTMNTSIFIIPADQVKNRKERLVILNKTALSVIEEMRGIHPDYVFTYKGRRIQRMNETAWRRARKKVGLPQVRVHDLKHTFGRRLRAAGVSLEDRQDLLGHESGKITTHYSQPEIGHLIEMANRICRDNSRKSPALVILKQNLINEMAAVG